MAITFGQSGTQITQITKNFDALLSTSLATYGPKMIDVISSSNPLFHEIKKSGMWQLEQAGVYIAEDLMYELNSMDSYDGYDELPDTPQDGVTQAHFEWRQGVTPITYNMKEIKQNRTRLHKLAETKIKQAELGMIESFSKYLLLGSAAQGAAGYTGLITPYTSTVNGSQFITPLCAMIDYIPSASRSIGNINQSTSTWWRNQSKTSAATTYLGFLMEMEHMYNDCSKGMGGQPNLIVTDQTTYELLNAAYYAKYQTMTRSDANYPFDNIRFRNARVVWDERMPDVHSGTTNTDTYGTAFFMNTNFLAMKVESDTNFTMTDFQKPPKGDSRLAHILFMGQFTATNRRKQGVIGKIPRTLS